MSEENKNLNGESTEEPEESAVGTEGLDGFESVLDSNIETADSAEESEEVTADETGELVEAVEAVESITEPAEADGDTEPLYEEFSQTSPADIRPSNQNAVKAVVIAFAAVVIIAVIVVFAVFGKTWFNPYEKGYIDVTGVSVGEIADMNGMEYDEFLEYYGLPSDMPETTSSNAAEKHIPVGRYAELMQIDLDELIEMMGWDSSVINEETTLGEALDSTTLANYVGEENLASFKEQYELGDDVTGETTWGEVRNAVELKQKAIYDEMRAEQEAEDTEEDAEEDIEEDATADDESDTDESETADGASDTDETDVTESDAE